MFQVVKDWPATASPAKVCQTLANACGMQGIVMHFFHDLEAVDLLGIIFDHHKVWARLVEIGRCNAFLMHNVVLHLTSRVEAEVVANVHYKS